MKSIRCSARSFNLPFGPSPVSSATAFVLSLSQKIRRSEDQKIRRSEVRRSEDQKIRRSEDQKSEDQKIRRSEDQKIKWLVADMKKETNGEISGGHDEDLQTRRSGRRQHVESTRDGTLLCELDEKRTREY